MPELPEVQALAEILQDRLTGQRVASCTLIAFSALKTHDPALDGLVGARIQGCRRFGKFLVLDFEQTPAGDSVAGAGAGAGDGDIHLAVHLAKAGWLKMSDKVPSTPARPGRGPGVLRLVTVTDDGEPGWSVELTEAGTRKSLALYVIRDPAAVPGIETLGPDALALTDEEWAGVLAAGGATRLKGLLRDQRVVSGIGNAYSDEILHAARLSPYATGASLSETQRGSLVAAVREVLAAASERSRGRPPEQLKDDKRSGMSVHGRSGRPCPVCGTTVAEVVLADSSFQYCPTCQTGGKKLADRRMSRLLK